MTRSEERQIRAEIFKDTTAFCKENKVLSETIRNSKKKTKLYEEDDYPYVKNPHKSCTVSFSGERTYEAAVRLINENPGKKVAVLNFASATRPGGGVTSGAGAQEECLCRTSTLYPLLNTKELKDSYYKYNKEHVDNLHTDAVIYTPDVVICKTDTDFPERIPESEFKTVDVLTCAAPNFRISKEHGQCHAESRPKPQMLTSEEQYELHYKRCSHILSVAAANGVDIMILGAFGCGAFKNDPYAVADAMAEACKDYREYFDIVHFAVLKREAVNENYSIFAKSVARCR